LLLSAAPLAGSLDGMSRKWGAVAAGAAVVALLAGGLTLAFSNGKNNAPRIVTSTVSANIQAPATKQDQAASQHGGAADESDPTGDDRSEAGSDNQAGDRGGDDQAGDRGGDNQAGDKGGDNRAGDNASGSQP